MEIKSLKCGPYDYKSFVVKKEINHLLSVKSPVAFDLRESKSPISNKP